MTEFLGKKLKVLFDVCKNSNIFVSFGKVESHNPDSLEFKINVKKCLRQLQMEKYFCVNDFDVYDKYQDKKDDFTNWLDNDISWSKHF